MAEVWRLGDENRKENEFRLLGLLKGELAEKLSGYVLSLDENMVSSGAELHVISPELQALIPKMKATISFRYEKGSFLSDWKRKPAVGIQAYFERDGTDGYRKNQRSYGFDFEKEQLKPGSFQKLVSYLKGETETKIFRCKATDSRKKAQKELLQQASAKLKAAGYEVTASQYDLSDGLVDRDVNFKIRRPNGKFEQSLKVLTSGELHHNLGTIDLKDVANFVGCLEQALRYVK